MSKEKEKSASEKIQDELTPLEILDGIDVSDAPPLQPPGTLRIRQRKGLILLGDRMRELADPDADPELYLDIVEGMDQALEKVAVDPVAYAAWAVGTDLEQRVMKLFLDYSGKLGESTRSAS